MKQEDTTLLLRDYRLTTANIFYHFPDHPSLLQSYIWQELDLAPLFPELKKFLGFWEDELEGKIHSVDVVHAEAISADSIIWREGSIRVH